MTAQPHCVLHHHSKDPAGGRCLSTIEGQAGDVPIKLVIVDRYAVRQNAILPALIPGTQTDHGTWICLGVW